MTRLLNLFEVFFGCHHEHTTWPMLRNNGKVMVTCTTCGKVLDCEVFAK